MPLLRRTGLLACLGLLSCEPASIATPPPVDTAEEGWELQAEWPKLPPERALGRVLGVAVDSRGRVWLSHTGAGEGPPEILALDPQTGVIVATIDASGFESPHALAWDDEGHLWVTDDAADRVVVLDEEGRVLRTLGGR